MRYVTVFNGWDMACSARRAAATTSRCPWFDAEWAIGSRRDFRRAVRAMITQAITEGQGRAADDPVPRRGGSA